MSNKRLIHISGLILCLLTATVIAQQAGESVSIDQPQFSDQYLAGRIVQVTAPIQGDLVVAGQELVVDAPIGGDLIAAGASLNLQGSVSDDVRAAGWALTLDAPISGHVVAAGEEIVLTSDASVGDWAWLAGRSVTVAGQVGQNLRAAGQRVMVSGEIGGDAVLAADEIQIEPGAVIRGDLVWDGETEPEISTTAVVEGEILRGHFAGMVGEVAIPGASGSLASAVMSALAIIVASFLAFLLFPGFSGAAASRVRSMPLRTLGLGIGVIAAIPLVIILLFISRIGWIVAFAVLIGYLLLLLCAFVFGIVSMSKLGLDLVRKDEVGRRLVHLLVIALGVVLFLLLAQIPILGIIVIFLVLFIGIGAMSAEFWQRYRQPA